MMSKLRLLGFLTSSYWSDKIIIFIIITIIIIIIITIMRHHVAKSAPRCVALMFARFLANKRQRLFLREKKIPVSNFLAALLS